MAARPRFRPMVSLIAAGLVFGMSAARAGISEGNQYYLNQQYDKAFAEYKPLAESGLARAQYIIGRMYERGQHVVRDTTAAGAWYRRAADQGHALAQARLSLFLFRGTGGTKDPEEAFVWATLSRRGLTGAPGTRAGIAADKMGLTLSAAARARAQERIRTWRPRLRKVETDPRPGDRLVTRGSGFFISSSGLMLTNEHVAAPCDRITVRHKDGTGAATTLAIDPIADLALLRVSGGVPGTVPVFAGPSPQAGTPVTIFGYSQLLSNSPAPLRFDGAIVEPEGARGNIRSMETSARTEKGMSGSPMLDTAGRLIGVAHGSRLKKGAAPRKGVQGDSTATGPGVDAVRAFLDRSDAQFTLAPIDSPPAVFSEWPPYVALIECWVRTKKRAPRKAVQAK